jgi:transposase
MDISEILNFFLPIEIIDHFDLVKIKEFNNGNGLQMEIYFDEKHQYPEGYQDGELESKGFHELIKICDFPIRNKKVMLCLRRRRWVDKETRKFVSNHYDIKHDGTNYTKGLAQFLKEELDNHPVSSSSLAKTVHLNGSQLSEIYKDHLSDYHSWDQSSHSEKWLLFPENIGEHLCLDETSLTYGEVSTILTNADAKTQKGCLVAIIDGVKSADITAVLKRISLEKRNIVKEVSIDMANNMEKAARESFPDASIVTDRFHVAKLVNDAVQDIRVGNRWIAIEEESEDIKKAKDQGIDYVEKVYSNGETKKQLLARSRYFLFKNKSKWSKTQKERAKILFKEYPTIKTAYGLAMMLRNIYEKSKTKEEAMKAYEIWEDTVTKKIEIDSKKSKTKRGLNLFNTVMKSFNTHREGILNFFTNRTTNALAECFNSKLKAFRRSFRGVKDLQLFLYRVSKIYS